MLVCNEIYTLVFPLGGSRADLSLNRTEEMKAESEAGRPLCMRAAS